MAKKKRHINNLDELNQALRVVGGTFPHTIEELDQSFKLSDKDEINRIASKYSFDDIWNAPEPLSIKRKSSYKTTELQIAVNESWGIAARGSIELSENVCNQMIKNEKEKEK